MFTQERYQYIVNKLNREGKVLVKDLSTTLNLSESMIRKDLQALEKKRLLQRTYGGAIPVNEELSKTKSFVKRSEEDTEKKQLVAKKAFDQIHEYDTIFLDASTCSFFIAKLIIAENLSVTVITNMYEISSLIPEQSNTEFIFIGGQYNAIVGGSTGSIANEQIRGYRCNKAFIGCVSVDTSDGSILTAQAEDASMKKAILSISVTTYLLMLNDKFNKNSSFVYSNLSDFTCIITEKAPDTAILSDLSDYPITLL